MQKEMTVSEMGKRGGAATSKKYGKAHYERMGRLSGKSKRRKIKQEAGDNHPLTKNKR